MKDLLELLVTHGADVNAPDQIGWTPLHEAADRGRMAAVEYLVAKGADLNARTTDDRKKASAAHYYWRIAWTPLQAAEYSAHKDVMRFLMSRGADATIRQAVYAGALEIVARLLAEGADVNEREPGTGDTLLHRAAYEGDEEMVELLLAKGADANAETPKRPMGPDLSGTKTPLHNAAYQGHQRVAKLLIAAGADINARNLDSSGNTPLRLALDRGHVATAAMLISRGADINARNDKGETPLHVAAFTGYASLVEMLLAGEARIDVTDDDGWTPLHKAAYNGHTVVVGLLLAAGADRTITGSDVWMGTAGKTALEFAREAGFADIVELFGGRVAGSSPLGAGPYRVIITDPQEVRRFLHFETTRDIDDVWIPQESDLAGLEESLKAYLEEDVPRRTQTWFDRAYVLASLRRYDREYSGFVRNGTKYIICQMHRGLDLPIDRTPRNSFTPICDGGCSVVRVVFDAQSRSVVGIDCNGM
jgi:ankyrin repeat protein